MERPLHCYAYVEASFDLVTRLVAENTQSLLQAATDEASEQAEALSRPLRVAVGGFEIGRDIRVVVGPFEPRGITRSSVPLRWHAETGQLLFPQLAADLEVSALTFDPPLTQITLAGSYEPSLGVIGAGADRLLLHRLAEATVHRFVHELADRVRRLVEGSAGDER